MNVRPMPQSFRRRLLTALVAAVCLAPAVLPIAPATAGYKPPNKKPPQRTETTASRSGNYTRAAIACKPAVAATLLTPMWNDTEIQTEPQIIETTTESETTSDKPPILLYIHTKRKGDITLTYRLHQNGLASSAKSLWSKAITLSVKTNGDFVEIPYPADQAPLEVNQIYQWQVDVPCRDGLQTVAVGGKFMRIPVSAELSSQLNQAKTATQKAEIYAAAGLWSEAFINSPKLSIERKNLLQEIGLSSRALKSPPPISEAKPLPTSPQP